MFERDEVGRSGYGSPDGRNLIKLGGALRPWWTEEKCCATSDPNLASRTGTC